MSETRAMDGIPVLNVLVTGGSGESGIAVAGALREAGFRIFTVGSDQSRIEAAAARTGEGVTPLVCDLASLADVRALRDSLAGSGTTIDAVIHLVGGWRGAKGIPDQSDSDWEFLERGAITTLRNVSRVFYTDLADSVCGRFAMVSSTAVGKPTAAAASYAAAKAAAEAWTMAMAEGFSRTESSAAVVLVVKALVDETMRKRHPERTFPGATDVRDLAAAVVGLFSSPAAGLNGERLLLTP
ncbi:3-oxoacyl-[acyl-carrier protein] reductase [Arthrobacter pascens]|nr:3-oxoacyl-[acyl-carrier protein] reductase [Arthrobacter pascens]